MLSELLLLSGNDIPFPGARVNIHQPTLKEIALIGEDQFFIGCGFLNFSKDLLADSDKVRLSNYNDFDIFMSIIRQNSKDTKRSIEAAFLVLTLIFPLYQIFVRDNVIVLQKEQEEYSIDKNNFNEFKKIIVAMFNLNIGGDVKEEYNPAGDMANRIAEKFKKRHEQLMKIANEQNKTKQISILSRYASILAIGLQLSLNEIMQWTVSQLYNEFQRFQMKMQWDAYIQAKMAGAKDLEEVDNWMIDFHDQEKNKNKK